MATAHTVDPAWDQFLALLAILTRTVAKVRLFEDTDGDRAQRFEATLPTTQDLRAFAGWFLTAPASAGEETVLVSSRQSGIGHPQHDPDLFLQALQRLTQPAGAGVFPFESTGEPPIFEVPGFKGAPDPSGNRSAVPAWLFDAPIRQPDTTLDFVFHRSSETWHLELSPGSELRGESLAELRRKAPLLPDPSEPPPYDLPGDAYFTVSAAAKHLDVDRSTVTRRVHRNEVIGFTVFKRALRIPKDQFLHADVVSGIPELLAMFPKPAATSDNLIDHRSAWAFLAGDLFHGDSEPRPIDRLRTADANGTTESVLADLARAKESLDRGDHL